MTLKFWKYLITHCNGSAICIVADPDRKCAEKELECDPRLLSYIAQPQFECPVLRCPAESVLQQLQQIRRDLQRIEVNQCTIL